MPSSTTVEHPQSFWDSLSPGIEVILPTDERWIILKAVYNKATPQTSAIIRPQNASHVQEIVRACVSHGTDFTVRSGGHDVMGRSQIKNGVTIDLRSIDHVQISKETKTAKIGGGILTRELTRALGKADLVTPTGPIASIGYVGWATLGGYGPLSGRYGLGVDQITSAQYVNCDGDLINADEETLKCFRGGGGCVGIITELTINVYPLKKILAGNLSFDSSNIQEAWSVFTQGYNKLLEGGDFPASLSAQPTSVAIPGLGIVFTAMVCWANDDHEKGREWIGKISALGNCVMNSVSETTWHDYCEENEIHAGLGGYGRAWTLNFRHLTSTTAKVLAKYSAQTQGPGMLVSAQLTRGADGFKPSVFQPRETHYWLEIVGVSSDPEVEQEAAQWAANLKKELVKSEPTNILDSQYIGFTHDDEVDLKHVYGDRYEELVSLKRRLDPNNIYRNSVPRFSNAPRLWSLEER
ncbi:hypothetical protein ACHAPJ_013491 [Fusarium lateritium]